MMFRGFLLVVALSGLGFAQQPQPGQPASESAKMPAPLSAITAKEKLKYHARHVFDVEYLVFAGIGATIDQGRDRPGEWGQGWGAFSERYASHIGQYLVQRSIMYPVQALDHEDARYIRSNRTSYQGRIGDAFLHTVWRRADSGEMMPAYSEVFGDYGAAAISRLWWPERFHKGSSIFIAGSNTMLIDGAINVFHEFKPDLKHWLHLGR